MRRAGENRSMMPANEHRTIEVDDQALEMRGNAEPAAPHLAAEDAARERAMRAMPAHTIDANRGRPMLVIGVTS